MSLEHIDRIDVTDTLDDEGNDYAEMRKVEEPEESEEDEEVLSNTEVADDELPAPVPQPDAEYVPLSTTFLSDFENAKDARYASAYNFVEAARHLFENGTYAYVRTTKSVAAGFEEAQATYRSDQRRLGLLEVINGGYLHDYPENNPDFVAKVEQALSDLMHDGNFNPSQMTDLWLQALRLGR